LVRSDELLTYQTCCLQWERYS